jgi:ankyrin repeat protein
MRSRRLECAIATFLIVALFVLLQFQVRQARTRQLAYAAHNGELLNARLLIAKGADVNGRDGEGDSILMSAVRFNQPAMVRLLEKNGAQPNAKTQLMAAALMNRPEVAQRLLRGGLSANVKDRDGDTALAYAAQWGNVEVVKVLIAHGADVNNTNVRGEKPLHWAAKCSDSSKRRAIMQMLRGAGATGPG